VRTPKVLLFFLLLFTGQCIVAKPFAITKRDAICRSPLRTASSTASLITFLAASIAIGMCEAKLTFDNDRQYRGLLLWHALVWLFASACRQGTVRVIADILRLPVANSDLLNVAGLTSWISYIGLWIYT
jgi:hypothetical protein